MLATVKGATAAVTPAPILETPGRQTVASTSAAAGCQKGLAPVVAAALALDLVLAPALGLAEAVRAAAKA